MSRSQANRLFPNPSVDHQGALATSVRRVVPQDTVVQPTIIPLREVYGESERRADEAPPSLLNLVRSARPSAPVLHARSEQGGVSPAIAREAMLPSYANPGSPSPRPTSERSPILPETRAAGTNRKWLPPVKTRILIGEELDDYMAPIANRPLPTPNVDSGQPPPWAANESECQNSNHALELPTQDEAAVAERPRHYELFSLPPDIDRTPVPHGDRSWLAIVAGSVVALVVVSLIAGVFFPKERMALQAKLFPDASPPTVISAAVAEHETPIWFDGLQPTAEEHKLLTEAAEALAGGDITKALSIYEKLQGMEPSSLVYEQLVRALRGQQVRLQSVTGSHGF